MDATERDWREVIALFGPDTRSFLQGLVTNDVERLAPENPLYAALLSPQGKILFDFFITDGGSGTVHLDCWGPIRDVLIKRLSMYRLRANVVIQAAPDFGVTTGTSSPKPAYAFEDPRLPSLGWREIAPLNAKTNVDNYFDRRLSLGVPEASDFGSDKMFALDAGLDELHALSFDKGCYVGQELTARMKHRGTARKRMLVVQSDIALTANADLRANGHSIGEIVSVYDNRGFALVRLDRLTEAGDAPVEADGKHVSIVKPGWLSGLT